jgi:hypothetical protein
VSKNLEHLLRLAHAGSRRGGASGAEKQARKIVACVIDNAIGLDGSASSGITELIELVQMSPQDGRDLAKKCAGIR